VKKISLKLLLLAALTSLAAPSYADLYLGGSAGQIKASDACDGLITTKCDDSDSAYKLFGGFRFGKFVALEAFYTDLGKISATTTTVEAEAEEHTFGAAVVGILPVSKNFDLFAKLGVHRWDADGKGTGQNQFATVRVNVDDSGTDIMGGLGMSYSFTDSFAIRAEWENYEAGDNYDMFSAGITFGF